MAVRALAVLVLLAHVALGADISQVFCFGADGHVAVERITNEEHTAAAGSSDALRLTGGSHGGPAAPTAHVDIIVAEPALKMAAPLLAPVSDVAAAGERLRVVARLLRRAPISFYPSRTILRSTVLRL